MCIGHNTHKNDKKQSCKIGVRQRHLFRLKTLQIKPRRAWQAIYLVRPLGRRASPQSPSWHLGYRDGASMTNGTILFAVGRFISARRRRPHGSAPRCPEPGTKSTIAPTVLPSHALDSWGQSLSYARRSARPLRIGSGRGRKMVTEFWEGWSQSLVSADLASRSYIQPTATMILGQLVFHPSGVGKSSTSLRRGSFTCVGWQVTLWDHIWQVTSRSSRTSSHRGFYSALTFKL